MDDKSPGIRRLCVALNEAEPSQHRREGAGSLQWLPGVFAAASASSGLERALIGKQRIGAREVALLLGRIDEPRAIARLVDELFRVLNQRNDILAGEERVRVGMAIHEGITWAAADGFTGPAITKTYRLLVSQPLLATFVLDPGANLVAMVSDQVYADMGEFGDIVLPIDRFSQVEVRDQQDGHRDIAWICAPKRTV